MLSSATSCSIQWDVLLSTQFLSCSGNNYRSLVQVSADGSMVTLGFELRMSSHGPVGGSAMVCGGSGVGQHARIVASSQRASDNATVLTLSPPLDAHVVAGESTLCLTATVGSKIISGNSFNNGMVVQWFGTTSRGVIADNNFTGTLCSCRRLSFCQHSSTSHNCDSVS